MERFPLISLGFAVTLVAMLLFYLASPHQRWLRQRRFPGLCNLAGALLCVCGFYFWTQALSLVAGMFALLLMSMMLLPLWPLLSLLLPPSAPKPAPNQE